MNYQVNLELIKERRIAKGYSLSKMGSLIGLDKSMYYKRENGETNFKASEVPVLANSLGLNLEKIFVSTLRK